MVIERGREVDKFVENYVECNSYLLVLRMMRMRENRASIGLVLFSKISTKKSIMELCFYK